jgi:hypothetical protein
MERIAVFIMAVVLAASCTACTTTPGDTGTRAGKVADQRLAAYTPIRRLTYRDVCGSEGPLTICVDRITLSDDAALVEARVRNASPQPYVQGDMKEASVILEDDTGMTLVWDNVGGTEYQGLEERVVRFRMEGHFSGEPAIIMVNNIRRKSSEPADRGFSLVARLGE